MRGEEVFELEVRRQLSEDEIRQGIASTLAKVTTAKLPGHGINDPSFIQPTRPMSAIGG